MPNLLSLGSIPLRSGSLHLRPESAGLDSAELDFAGLESAELSSADEFAEFDFAELESAEVSLNLRFLNFARLKRWRVVVWFAARASGVC